MHRLMAAYFKITAYIPRRLPMTVQEWYDLKRILNQYYGLEDHPQTWYTVSSQLLAGPPTSLRRSYGLIANATKKLRLIALVQSERDIAAKELNARLEEKVKEAAHAFEAETKEADLQHSQEIRPQWSDIVPGAVSKSEPIHVPDMPSGTQHLQGDVQAMPDTPQGMVSVHRA